MIDRSAVFFCVNHNKKRKKNIHLNLVSDQADQSNAECSHGHDRQSGFFRGHLRVFVVERSLQSTVTPTGGPAGTTATVTITANANATANAIANANANAIASANVNTTANVSAFGQRWR